MPYDRSVSRVKDLTAFMSEARENFKLAMALDQEDRDAAAEDSRFAGGDQWHPDAVESRKRLKRPILTWNRIPIFTAQVVNDGRQSKPAIRVTAMDGGTKETADVIQGRIRHIEYESNAEIAYNTSRDQQVTTGRGFYRVTTKFKPGTFDQDVCIERIENQFSVVWGPHREYDCSDADFCFVLAPPMTREAFTKKYGKDAALVRNAFYQDSENPAPDWVGIGAGGQMVQVAEYWVRYRTPRQLAQLADGSTCWADEAPQRAKIVEQREDEDVTVCQYVIDGVEIHDETDWSAPKEGIPIIPVWGREQVVEGKRRTTSLHRSGQDCQRLINLYVSNIAEELAKMPRNPFRAPAGSIAGFEDLWEKINEEVFAVIPYNQWDEDGRELRPPEREIAEPPIQALTLGLNQAIDGLKASMGIFDASLGARSNETAGIAIERRQREADNANFHFHDNEAISRKRAGRIVLCLIRKLDAGKSSISIRSEDGKTRQVKLGVPYMDDELGKVVTHDLSQGDYGLAVSTGPSYTSARREAFDTYSQIASADPRFMQLAGDLLFRYLDAPGSEQIADRYEKALPPPLQPQKPGQTALPPQVQAMLQQGKQAMLAQSQLIDELRQKLETKQPDLEVKVAVAQMQEETKRLALEAQIRIAELNAGVTSSLGRLEQEIKAIQHSLDLADAQQARIATFSQPPPAAPPEAQPPQPMPQETQPEQ